MEKRTILKCFLTSLLALVISVGIAYATDYKNDIYQYSMEYSGFGRDEIVLVTITFMCDSPSHAETAVKPLAVHSVLFMENAPHPGTAEQKELVTQDAMTRDAQKYFDTFFADKQYNKYVTSVGTSKMQITKVKKMYQITVQVAVDKRNLRIELENQKIIKSLDQIFKTKNEN